MISQNPCKTCKWLEVEPTKTGRRVVYRNNAYKCSFEVEQPELPFSITNAYRFQWPLQKSWIAGDTVSDCPCWEPL